jgi:hypothetical protein
MHGHSHYRDGITYFVGFLIGINLIYFFDSHFAKGSLILSKVYAVIGPEFQRNCLCSPIIEAMYTALMFQKLKDSLYYELL